MHIAAVLTIKKARKVLEKKNHLHIWYKRVL